jgi:hypothetical protein
MIGYITNNSIKYLRHFSEQCICVLWFKFAILSDLGIELERLLDFEL